MTLTTRRRLVLLLFWVQLWALVATDGIASVGGRHFSTALRTSASPAFGIAPSSRHRYKVLSDDDRINNAVIGQLRGGEIALPDEDEEESGMVLTKLRNVIRNLLEFGDKKIPALSGILRSCFKTMENLTGLKLLPSKKKKKKGKKKGKSKENNSKAESTKENDGESSGEKKKKTKKSSALKKPSETTKKHLETSIKSSNPNFRIQKELKEFIKSPPPNLSVQVGSNIRVWVVTMVGANNTIYEGEVFKLRISFPPQYPTVPPSVYFLKGYIPTHEHIYTNGDICLSLLGKDWRPTMTAQSIAVSILSILSSAQSKSLPMDNAAHAHAKPGEYQENWVYHDDSC